MEVAACPVRGEDGGAPGGGWGALGQQAGPGGTLSACLSLCLEPQHESGEQSHLRAAHCPWKGPWEPAGSSSFP